MRFFGGFDVIHERFAAFGVETCERFVENEQFLCAHQCAGQSRSLAFSAGKCGGMTGEKLFYAEKIYKFVKCQ